ncbi:hypothetical protein CR513_15130, partial [Mucuna pruriens]
MEPTTTKFLHYYVVRLGPKTGWMSLTSILKTCLFNMYSTLYRGFKGCFVKVQAVNEVLFTLDCRSIPSHWTPVNYTLMGGCLPLPLPPHGAHREVSLLLCGPLGSEDRVGVVDKHLEDLLVQHRHPHKFSDWSQDDMST